MSKKRTRKDKSNARHQFALSWSAEAGVKRQNTIAPEAKSHNTEAVKKAHLLAKDAGLTEVKKNLTRSLILVSFILCLELVIYLAWK